jgi:hypothetical protein
MKLRGDEFSICWRFANTFRKSRFTAFGIDLQDANVLHIPITEAFFRITFAALESGLNGQAKA